MSYSESLLYSGYSQLNLTQIFMASIFIGASGAVMDLAVDITSAVNEVAEKRPDIGFREAVKSGFAVGRAALSTQTTTLLLAYSGGYIALLMVFMAQGTPRGRQSSTSNTSPPRYCTPSSAASASSPSRP